MARREDETADLSPDRSAVTPARRQQGSGAASMLARLLLVLSLALVGAHPGAAERTSTPHGSEAILETALSQVILTPKIQLLRVQMPDGDTPPLAPSASVLPEPMQASLLHVPQDRRTTLSPVAIQILPPVRGPPAV